MADLFRRAFSLQVGEVLLSDLDITFKVVRHLRREPNTCEVGIYNLNADHRRQLAELRHVFVRLEAGYVGATFLVAAGDLSQVSTTREGPDFVTRISAGDGAKRYREARVQKSFRGASRSLDAAEFCATALGLGLGNLREAFAAVADTAGFLVTASPPRAAQVRALARQIASRTLTVSGPAARELFEVLESCGMEGSIQNGVLQVTLLGEPIGPETAVVLSPETGLLESPSEASDGVVTAKTLMIADLEPGRKVEFQTREVSGFYRIETSTFVGSTFGPDWSVTVKCKGVR